MGNIKDKDWTTVFNGDTAWFHRHPSPSYPPDETTLCRFYPQFPDYQNTSVSSCCTGTGCAPHDRTLSISPAYVPLKVLRHRTAWSCSSLFPVHNNLLNGQKAFSPGLYSPAQPCSAMTADKWTSGVYYSAAVELPVSSRSFAPAHCFCSWLSVWGETFQVCRPIFVRLHFFKKCSSEKLFTSPGVVVFADIVRLFKEPTSLAINITCWLLHARAPRTVSGLLFRFQSRGRQDSVCRP